MSPPKIALFSDQPDWHARQLRRAFNNAGAQVEMPSLAACGFADDAPGHIAIPGFADRLPDAVMVRSLTAGSFEQITVRLGLLHALQRLGVPVFNDAPSIERTVDKAMSTFLFYHAGIPTPPTWVVQSAAEAAALVATETAAGFEVVLKPLFGAQGRGLMRLSSPAQLPPPDEVAGLYYLQRYIGAVSSGWHDWRVFVIGGRAVAAMLRHGEGWITNVYQGGRCEAVAADGMLAELALAAAAAVGTAYAGVDIIRDPADNLQVLEVNSMPAWYGLQGTTADNIAQLLVEDLLFSKLSPPLIC